MPNIDLNDPKDPVTVPVLATCQNQAIQWCGCNAVANGFAAKLVTVTEQAHQPFISGSSVLLLSLVFLPPNVSVRTEALLQYLVP